MDLFVQNVAEEHTGKSLREISTNVVAAGIKFPLQPVRSSIRLELH